MSEANKKHNLLITGGAGFIGSNLVEHFLSDPRIALVRVLDDLSNGYYENIQEFEDHPRFEFIKGDITDYDTCYQACAGIDKISHQAALGSVPRSIENPMRTNEVNVGGTVNILHAAKENGIDRVVLAFSSSTYGDHPGLPKVEGKEGKPLSPYAVSKAAIEQYADVFQKTYGLNYIGLRYFNIFGPKQMPDNPYAAVIPIFCQAFIDDKAPTINGDGKTSRDFTFVDNAILANELALFVSEDRADKSNESIESFDADKAQASSVRSPLNQVYNVACGDQMSLNDMISLLQEISGKDIKPQYGPERPGDVRHSNADISKIENLLGYNPKVRFKEGLEKVYKWYQTREK